MSQCSTWSEPGLALVGGDKVVEGCEGAVAGDAELGVGMTGVVEDLIFAADG